jgi:formate dehydrogenase subunit beta
MTYNVAKWIPKWLQEHPDQRLGVLLRPCELRALVVKAKREGFSLDRLVTICVDCLGTYPAEDYPWRAERKGSSEKLTDETLQFARQGGIAAYRYRSACQMCKAPYSQAADLNIGVIGLPVRQTILVTTRDQAAGKKLGLEAAPASQAYSPLLEGRQRSLAKLVERHGQTRQRITDGLADILPKDIHALLERFEQCADCRECLDACPLCDTDFPQRTPAGRYQRVDLVQWMLSCAGCGMCEQTCPEHFPLATAFAYIRQQLDKLIDDAPEYIM